MGTPKRNDKRISRFPIEALLSPVPAGEGSERTGSSAWWDRLFSGSDIPEGSHQSGPDLLLELMRLIFDAYQPTCSERTRLPAEFHHSKDLAHHSLSRSAGHSQGAVQKEAAAEIGPRVCRARPAR